MGCCVSSSRVRGQYDVSPPSGCAAAVISSEGAAGHRNRKSTSGSWNHKQPQQPSAEDKHISGKQRSSKNGKHSSKEKPAKGSSERDRSSSRSGKERRTSTRGHSSANSAHSSPASHVAPPRNGANGAADAAATSFKDGAALVAASSASELALEEAELDDWQRGMLDIMEEQSIQAYDMDVSQAAGGGTGERRYSNSFMGFPSMAGNQTPAAGFESPLPPTASRNSIRMPHRLLSAPSHASAAAAAVLSEPNPSILVVDEHPSTRQIISKWLSSSRYTEISCASGAQAVDVLSPPTGSTTLTMHVDLIVCDVTVHAREGQLLLDWVLRSPTSASIPVIVLSSNLPSQGIERLIRRGAWDVLHKPLNRAVFLNAVRTVFTARRQKAFLERLRVKGDEYKERYYSKARGRAASRVTQLASSLTGVVPTPMSPSAAQFGSGSGSSGHSGASGYASPRPTPGAQPITLLLIETNPVTIGLLKDWVESDLVHLRVVASVADALPIIRDSQKAALLAASSYSPPQIQFSLPSMTASGTALLPGPGPMVRTQSDHRLTPAADGPSLRGSMRAATEHHFHSSLSSPAPAVTSLPGGRSISPIASITGVGGGTTAPSTPGPPTFTNAPPITFHRDRELGHGPLGLGLIGSGPLSTPSTPVNHKREASISLMRGNTLTAPGSNGLPSPGSAAAAVRRTTSILASVISTQQSFGVEMILVGHDILLPPELLTGDELLASAVSGDEEDGPDDEEEEDGPEGAASPTTPKRTVSPPASSNPSKGSAKTSPSKAARRILAPSLASSQMLVDLSLQPVWGRRRRLPFVVITEADGPSPVAMALLKHAALTILNLPLSQGLVEKKMGILLGLIEANRQSLLLARRAHMYEGLLFSLLGSDESAGGGASASPDDVPPASPGMRYAGGGGDVRSRLLSLERSERMSGGNAGGGKPAGGTSPQSSNGMMKFSSRAHPTSFVLATAVATPPPSLSVRPRPSVVAETSLSLAISTDPSPVDGLGLPPKIPSPMPRDEARASLVDGVSPLAEGSVSTTPSPVLSSTLSPSSSTLTNVALTNVDLIASATANRPVVFSSRARGDNDTPRSMDAKRAVLRIKTEGM